jgi:hypothetical protein
MCSTNSHHSGTAQQTANLRGNFWKPNGFILAQ